MDPYKRQFGPSGEQSEADPYSYPRHRSEDNRDVFRYDSGSLRANYGEACGGYSRNYAPIGGSQSYSQPVSGYSRMNTFREGGSRGLYESFPDSRDEFECDLHRSQEGFSCVSDHGPQSSFSQSLGDYRQNYGSLVRDTRDHMGTSRDFHGDRFSGYSNVYDYQMGYQQSLSGSDASSLQRTGRLPSGDRELEFDRCRDRIAPLPQRTATYAQYEKDTAHLRAPIYMDKEGRPPKSKQVSSTVSSPYLVQDRPRGSASDISGKEMEEGEISEDGEYSGGTNECDFSEKTPDRGYMPQSHSIYGSSLALSGIASHAENGAPGFPSSRNMFPSTQHTQGAQHVKPQPELNMQDDITGGNPVLASRINERLERHAGYQAIPSLMSINTGKH